MGGDMRYLIPLFFVLFSSSSFAVDYYWVVPGFPGNFSGPTQAANAFIASQHASSPPSQINYRLGNTRYHSPSHMQFCHLFDYAGTSNTNNSCWTDVYRYGDSCPDGADADPVTGECLGPPPDPCKEKEGLKVAVSRSGRAPDDFYGVTPSGLGYVKVNNACVGGCIVEIVDPRCKAWTSGIYSCRLGVIHAGVSCPAESAGPDLDNSDPGPVEPPQTVTEEKPCNYTTDANGDQVCESSKSTEKEGQTCGTVNGVETCVDTAPSKNGIDIRTDIKTEPTPDGGSKTTKTDTATVTKCDGIGKCVTTTTTTKTTTTKDGAGNETGSKTECKGPGCKSGGGVKDGTGEGTGLCANGDCSNEGFKDPAGKGGLDDAPGYGDSLNDFMQRVGASPLATAVTDIALPGGGSCSMPGRHVYMLGTISAHSMCDLADVLDGLRFVFLAFFGFAAVRVLMSA